MQRFVIDQVTLREKPNNICKRPVGKWRQGSQPRSRVTKHSYWKKICVKTYLAVIILISRKTRLDYDWLLEKGDSPILNSKYYNAYRYVYLDEVHISLHWNCLTCGTDKEMLQCCMRMSFSLRSLGLLAFLSVFQGGDLRPALCKDGKFYEESVFAYFNCSLCLEQSHYSNCNVCCSSK